MAFLKRNSMISKTDMLIIERLMTSLFCEQFQLQSGLVGVRGAIAPKLVATETALVPEHVLNKVSRQFQPPFPVWGNLNKQVIVPSGNAQVRKLRFKCHYSCFSC